MQSGLALGAYRVPFGEACLSGSSVQWPLGTLVELFGLSDSGADEVCFLLAGVLHMLSRSDPAPAGTVLRRPRRVDPEALSFVSLGGELLYGLPTQVRARRVGTIFGNPELYVVGDTVQEEFQYAHAAVGLPVPNPMGLSRYGLADKLDRRTEHLSGGELHRLNWACALELGPELVVADLSRANLDVSFLQELLDRLANDRRERVLLVRGHRPGDFAAEGSERWIVENGHLSPVTAPLSDFPDLCNERAVLKAAFGARVPGALVLAVDGLCRRGVTRPVSFSLRESEVLQVHGPNGVGKTTLGKALVGRIRRTLLGGSLRVANNRARPVMSLQYPERSLVRRRVCDEVLGVHALELCGLLPEDELRPARTLSVSKQKLVDVARALSMARGFAILDEPTAGMDHADKLRLVELLNAHGELAVLLFTHDQGLGELGNVVLFDDLAR